MGDDSPPPVLTEEDGNGNNRQACGFDAVFRSSPAGDGVGPALEALPKRDLANEAGGVRIVFGASAGLMATGLDCSGAVGSSRAEQRKGF